MIPPALVVLAQSGWKLDRSPRAIGYGLAVGLLGAGGQMLLFYAVARGPAYLIFPVISLSPIVTIALSALLIGERTGRLGRDRDRARIARAADLRFRAGRAPAGHR
jgi:drug/metabolite transporter (DMT)-like permease